MEKRPCGLKTPERISGAAVEGVNVPRMRSHKHSARSRAWFHGGPEALIDEFAGPKQVKRPRQFCPNVTRVVRRAAQHRPIRRYYLGNATTKNDPRNEKRAHECSTCRKPDGFSATC